MKRGRVLLLAIAVLLAGCTAQIQPHVLRIADFANPTSLNPLLAHDQETIGYDLLVVQTLTALDKDNRVVPLLLTAIPTRENGGITNGGRRIIYHLRRGVRFADGVELTSADVAFTYRAIVDPENPVESQEAYRRILSLKTPGRYTVVVNLRAPWNAAVSDLFAQSDFAFGILPAHAFASTKLTGAAWENRAFGSGPFRVTQWRRGDRIVLEPNPYFSPKPKLERVELRMMPDYNTGFIALRTHEVDAAVLRSPQTLRAASATPGIHIVKTPLNDTEEFDVLTTAPPTGDLRVRRAIAGALDMRGIAKAYDDIYATAGAFLPPVMGWAHDSSIRPYAFDPSLARAIPDRASHELTIVYQAENGVAARIATIVQAQLRAAGFRAFVKPYPTALFNAPEGPLRNSRFSLAFAGWLGGADPEQSITYTCAQATNTGPNNSRFCDKRFDAAFADQQTTQSRARRKADFDTMQQIMHDSVPTIPLYYETWFDGVDAHVRNFARNMLEFPAAPETWDVVR